MWFIQILGSFSALRIMNGGAPLQAFESKQLAGAGGIAALFSWLFFQSRFIARILAAWGVLALLFEGVRARSYQNDRGFGAVVSLN